MSKVNHRIRRASTRVYPRHWLILAGFATFLPVITVAVLRGAELVDSGWAVATPSPLATGQSTDVQQQMILQNVLEGTQQPLLKKAPTASTVIIGKPNARAAVPRVAVRPDGVDGWRPAAQAASPVTDSATKGISVGEAKKSSATVAESAPTQVGSAPLPQATKASGPELSFGTPDGPQLNGPTQAAPTGVATQTTKPERAREVECDCSGQPAVVSSRKPSASVAAQPSLADAYSNLTDGAAAKQQETPADVPSSTNGESTAPTMPAAGAGQPVPESASESAASKLSDGAAENKTPSENQSPAAATDSNSASSAPAKLAVPIPAEVTPPPPLTRQLIALRSRVRSVLKGYYRKQLNTADNDPWEVMHGMLAYGVNSRVRQGGASGAPITSVGWLCFNKPSKGQAMLYVNPEGELRAKYGVGLQGHLGQLLAMLAQCRVSADYPIQVGKDKFTIRDLIEAEKKTCYPKSELTFKLLALQYYIDLNDKWMNDQGLEWDFSRLLSEEMAQPVRTAACGGTHRLSALSLTVKTRIRRGEPVDGEYAEAADFVKKYQQYAFRLQNKDGSLSTQWFKGPGDEDDDDRRIKTTGHILEWLCYSLSDEELRDQRTIRAVSYLTNLMYSNYDHEWEIGPRSHATHALLLYDERVFQPFDKEGAIAFYLPQANVAKNNQSNGKKR